MSRSPDLRIFENRLFTIEHSSSCAVPGYVVLRLKDRSTSLAELDAGSAQALGVLLSAAVRAVEKIVGADRVYCLSFAELDRRLHFHLFPRTAWLLQAYWRATGTAELPVNGPLVFEWARAHLVSGSTLPAEAGSVDRVCAGLRAELAGA